MADYIKINPNAKSGELSISKNIVEEIAADALKNKDIASAKPLKISFQRNGKVKVSVFLAADAKDELSKKAKEAVGNALTAYVEAIPFAVEVKLVEAVK